jgi:hypothetical protein
MSAEPITTLSPSPETPAAPAQASAVRLWPAIALLVLFWAAFFIVGSIDKPYFIGFLYGLGSSGLLVLLFFGWWWTRRRIPLADRLYGFLAILGGGAIAYPLVHQSVGWPGLLMSGLPLVFTVWIVWMIVVQKTALTWSRLGAFILVALTWAYLTLIRIDGLDSTLRGDVRWRWSPSAEDLFLAEKSQEPKPTPAATETITLSPGDWPGFRGPQRDGVARGVTIASDWKASHPRLLWRQRVGPSWSSVCVIGSRLFTQEQRGEQEAVVCYDAATGKELWIHEDPARFWEPVSGAGPRATPTFADGRLYTLGATGILNCLDAASGRPRWSRNVAADAGAKLPMWGLSGSPLVVEGLAIVYAGGDGEKNLLAYHVETGSPAWTAAAGPSSYSSPQLATLAGTRQCLMLTDHGLMSVDPATGSVLWKGGVSWPGAPRTVQPRVLGATQLVAGTFEGTGVSLLDVTRDGEAWKVETRWTSKDLKPEFPDLVVHNGHAYGFDVGIFCCIDLESGKRCWKDGRYGRGQVVLLPEQSLLLVISESGTAILLEATPERHRELGRFQALKGKTWNHPVVAHGRLYVRNAEEIACYELAPSTGP